MRSRLVPVALVLTALSLPGLALAGPFRMLGFDTLALSQGGSESAYGRGIGVLYSNPALLVDVRPGFSVNYMFFQPFLKVELMDRPANADIPLTFYDSDVGIEGTNLDRPLPTAELRLARHDNQVDQTSMYLSLGFVHDFGVEDFRLGLGLWVPTSGLLNIESQFPDEREQYFSNTVHFTRFGEWSEVLSLLLGLAYQPLPWLAVGASAEVALDIGASIDMYIPEATVQDYALVNAGFDAKPTVRAIVGITGRPLDWLSFSLTWRDRRFSKVDATAMLNLWNYHEAGDETLPKRVEQRHLMALDFEPMEIALGAGLHLGDFTGQVSVTWNHWADFLDTHHKRAQENAVFEPVNEGDPTIDGSDFAFSDTWSLVVGATYEYLEGFTLAAGFSYRPTPVPAQVGRTSYVDADLFMGSLGHRFEFSLWEQSFRAELGFQLWGMPRTTVYKDPALIKDEFPDRARTLIGGQPMPEAEGLQTNNPGFPGYEFGGLALAGSLSLAYLF
ncbi:MAG TPA: outer membrane protein transport protein [Myxococcota bacterium]|nr:outer membrane protein transport protein [Myxococcota bacterium]HRY93376.1 outer membrane protein transport protein [Myxococcota bacterium]HSA23044.1 outer membrane protein transport protein [Myxococcota bacterium]